MEKRISKDNGGEIMPFEHAAFKEALLVQEEILNGLTDEIEYMETFLEQAEGSLSVKWDVGAKKKIEHLEANTHCLRGFIHHWNKLEKKEQAEMIKNGVGKLIDLISDHSLEIQERTEEITNKNNIKKSALFERVNLAR